MILLKSSLLVAMWFLLPAHIFAAPPECVVLLHGLARSKSSMKPLESFLSEQGYQVINMGYPSREYAIPELAEMVRKKVISTVPEDRKVHFVTHSMGGIIVRYIQKNDPLQNLGRVIMLSPPNHGSEVVDKLGDLRLFRWINGSAGRQLGTGRDSIPQTLGKVNFGLGVIMGDRSINWINSLFIPGKDDGKVSVESAKVEGMVDFTVVHVSHPYIMKDKEVMTQCLAFLRKGSFYGDRQHKNRVHPERQEPHAQ